ncbi:MAG: F0F1 ATP synthase subunit B [Acidimicrobiia bacterium]|nr:F0F1 ATP synthase subunit B [Acidimicrobiia bacterium]MYC57171.1 F0F1 ATP synthase subunit B [Acidimicrobiia bacterium]MYG93902.1 F0F1 ATP synthase subunit B [Acidimicrobiia bacterium]MYI29905.1 F0F1 ATP synthase subunit B [Acidimicrobiia bacterium]
MSRRLWVVAGVLVGTIAFSASAAGAVGETVGSCIFEELEEAQFDGIEGEGLSAVKNLKDRYKAGDEHAEEIKTDFEADLEDCIEAPNPILPEVTEIIWGGAAFVVLLALMRWKLFPVVKNLMEQRTQRIQDSIDDADRTRAEAMEVKASYEAELLDAKTEAARIVDEARQQAGVVRADLQARAEADIAEMRERAAADVEASKRQAIADLQTEVSDIALGAAEAVLAHNLENPEVQRQLIDDYINSVGAGQLGQQG